MDGLHSETEYHLRTLVDRLTTALVQETPVRVMGSEEWKAHPDLEPPVLEYRVADVAVLGDQILAVTVREIARLLFTRDPTWSFDVDTDPEAAELLLNVVETARVETKMSQEYAGCRSLFDEYNGDKPPNGAWSNPQVRRDFPKLPVKWRFILNIQRRLNGLSLVGDSFEVPWVTEVEPHFITAAQEDSTQACVDNLGPVYSRLLDAIARESEWKEEEEQYQRYCKQCAEENEPPITKQEWKDEGKPEGPPKFEGVEEVTVREPLPEDWERNENVSDFDHDAAEEDDGKPGGEDGSPGKRRDGRGEDGPDGSDESGDSVDSADSEGSNAGDSGGDEEDDGGSVEESDSTADDSEGESGEGTEGVSGEAEDGAEREAAPTQVKTGNIFRELVEDLDEGQGGKAVANFKNYFAKIDREAHKVEKTIAAEQENSLGRIAQALGNQNKTNRIRDAAHEGIEHYPTIRESLDPYIRHLRQYVETVLRDNERDRWGGSFKRGRKLKKRSLHRIVTQEEPLVFEKKVVLGGKSYCIGFVIDQSGSMNHRDYNEPDGPTPCILAGSSAVIAIEAFDGLIDTACTGFYSLPSKWGERDIVNFYKKTNESLNVVRPAFAQMFHAHGGTPLGSGLFGVLEEVKASTALNKSIITITDGVPTDGYRSIEAIEACHMARIPLHALAIGGIRPFHQDNFRRVIEITEVDMIVPGFFSLLQGIVKREATVA